PSRMLQREIGYRLLMQSQLGELHLLVAEKRPAMALTPVAKRREAADRRTAFILTKAKRWESSSSWTTTILIEISGFLQGCFLATETISSNGIHWPTVLP